LMCISQPDFPFTREIHLKVKRLLSAICFSKAIASSRLV
jgi:hypothetical protein